MDNILNRLINKNVRYSVSHESPGVEILLNGDPAEVACVVNCFSNFGIISRSPQKYKFGTSGGIPMDYREGIDDNVCLRSYNLRYEK